MDYIIVGGGPGGIQLAYELLKSGKKIVVLEKSGDPGSFFLKYPLHRSLISVNKIFPEELKGEDLAYRWDWNSLLTDDPPRAKLLFQTFSNEYFAPAEVMTQYCRSFVERFQIPVSKESVIGVAVSEFGGFDIETTSRKWKTKKLIMATGNHKEFIPGIEGIELATNYVNITHNPALFLGKRVLIIGKGNTGMETANMMMGTAASLHMISPSPVKFAWNTNFPGNVRAVNMTFLDSCLLSRDNRLLNGTIHHIYKNSEGKLCAKITEQDRTSLNVYDHIINCTGFMFDGSIFDDSCKPQLTHENRLPRMTDCFESTNVPSLYFAGALTSSRDFKKSSSAFIHGFRYNSRALGRYLNATDSGIPWPRISLGATNSFKKIAITILKRAETSSALWHLLEVMEDMFCIGKTNSFLLPEIPSGMSGCFDIIPEDFISICLSLTVVPQNESTTFLKKNFPSAVISVSSQSIIITESDSLLFSSTRNIDILSQFLSTNWPPVAKL